MSTLGGHRRRGPDQSGPGPSAWWRYADAVLTVGLTGGIGSGKSTVADLLGRLGAVVIDGDRVAREVVEPGTPALAAIAERFGARLLDARGRLDRAALAAVVFADASDLADLESITGPAIAARVAQLRSEVAPGEVTVFDMPLLVERRLWVHEHLCVVVGASPSVRLDRLARDRGMSRSDAQSRMAAQASDEERRAAADVWLDNDGPRSVLEGQVHELWSRRLVPFNDNLVTHRRSRRPEIGAVVDPDPTWLAQAARLVARIEDALGAAAVSVDHIGSTSVPGLVAKDVIDLQVTVRRLADADNPQFVERLEARGFLRIADLGQDTPHPAGDEPVRWQKRYHASADPGRVAHVHVRELGSPGWEFALVFRDWLRADEPARQAYAAHKGRLLAATRSTTEYVTAKEPWFDQAFEDAYAWARRTGWQPS